MCVLMDVALRGLFLNLTVSPLPNPVFATNGEISEILLPPRYSDLRFVKFDSADISDMLLKLRYSNVRFVKLDSADISDMLLEPRSSHVRFVKLDSADISDMLFL